MAASKTCTKCGTAKPLDAFYKKPHGRNGRDACCKHCKSAYMRDRYVTRKERLRRVDDSGAVKQCADCGEFKPATDFDRHPGRLDGRKRYCKPCRSVRARANSLMRQYGLTPERFAAMLASQNGGCAVCGAAECASGNAFAVDHDHSCCPGKKTCGSCVRGLLCQACNTGIGKLGDSVERLRAALTYLEGGAAA